MVTATCFSLHSTVPQENKSSGERGFALTGHAAGSRWHSPAAPGRSQALSVMLNQLLNGTNPMVTAKKPPADPVLSLQGTARGLGDGMVCRHEFNPQNSYFKRGAHAYITVPWGQGGMETG